MKARSGLELPATQKTIFMASLTTSGSIEKLAQVPIDNLSRNEYQKLCRYYLRHFAPPEYRQAAHEVDRLQSDLAELRRNYPTLMIME